MQCVLREFQEAELMLVQPFKCVTLDLAKAELIKALYKRAKFFIKVQRKMLS